jgi:hypothetical protein
MFFILLDCYFHAFSTGGTPVSRLQAHHIFKKRSAGDCRRFFNEPDHFPSD